MQPVRDPVDPPPNARASAPQPVVFLNPATER